MLAVGYVEVRTIYRGDVMEQIAKFPDNSVDVIFTSPPYFMLRDYDHAGQWGAERTIPEYLDNLMRLMQECRRVVKPTGNIWINIGDAYAGSSNSSSGKPAPPRKVYAADGTLVKPAKTKRKPRPPIDLGNVVPKSLLGMPERLLVRMIDDGFVCRNKTIWEKVNPTPSSAWDRLTNTWEPTYFFSISDPYFFDLAPIRVPAKTETRPFNIRVRESRKPEAKNAKLIPDVSEEEDAQYDSSGVRKGRRANNPELGHRQFMPLVNEKYSHVPGSNVARLHRDRPGNPNHTCRSRGCLRNEDHADSRSAKKQDNVRGAGGQVKRTYKGFNARWKRDRRKYAGVSGQTTQLIGTNASHGRDAETGRSLNHPRGKNPGDVVSLTHEPLKLDHFAAFPTKLPGAFLPAACPREVCVECGEPKMPHDGLTAGGQRTTTYLARCDCNAGWQPGLVLDPFAGSGSTLVAAKRLGFRFAGIEINPKYARVIRTRLAETPVPLSMPYNPGAGALQ